MRTIFFPSRDGGSTQITNRVTTGCNTVVNHIEHERHFILFSRRAHVGTLLQRLRWYGVPRNQEEQNKARLDGRQIVPRSMLRCLAHDHLSLIDHDLEDIRETSLKVRRSHASRYACRISTRRSLSSSTWEQRIVFD